MELLVLCQLTTEMHCNGSRPNQDHIKRQHSVKKRKKNLLGKAFMLNAYDIIDIKWYPRCFKLLKLYPELQYIYSVCFKHQNNSD